MTLTGGALAQDIDRRHFGDSSYVTFYDMILKHKKRTHPQANDVDENVLLVDVLLLTNSEVDKDQFLLHFYSSNFKIVTAFFNRLILNHS